MAKLNQYYLALGVSPALINTEFTVDAEHAFITDKYGNNCTYLGPPYINNCGYDTVGSLLQHLYSNSLVLPTKPPLNTSLQSFNQSQFVPLGYTLETAALADLGYVYYPSSCVVLRTCRLHVALHGCEQDVDMVGLQWVSDTGYNDWAEFNNIIILYPQARKTTLNPKGCWDWWGYTGVDYASKLGAQMQAIRSMADNM
jgi:hypothetical protein